MSAIWDTILILLALLLPPLSTFLKRGLLREFWICLLLTILGWIPGIIYAIYVVMKYHRHHYYRPRRWGGPVLAPPPPPYV